MSLTSSVPLGCDEILITVGDQPKAVEADSRHQALGFIRLSGVRAGALGKQIAIAVASN